MPRPPFDPDAPRDNYDEKDQTFFERFKDRVSHHASKRGAAEATWEDVWLTLLDNWETAKILEEKGIATRGLKRDIGYKLYFGKPSVNGEAEEPALTKNEAASIHRDTLDELVRDVREYARHSEEFAESPDYRDAAIRVANYLQQLLQLECEEPSEKQRLKVGLLQHYGSQFVSKIARDAQAHGEDDETHIDAAETLNTFARFLEQRDIQIKTGPLAALEGAATEFSDPSPHQLVDTAIRLANPFITYTLYRNGMVAPDDYTPPAKAHDDAIQTAAIHAFEYADKLREKHVSTKHLLGVMLEDWSIMKHLKEIEELELLAQKRGWQRDSLAKWREERP